MTVLLAGSAAITAAELARRTAHRVPETVPPLELTPSHRAGIGTPLLLLHGISAIWRVWSPVLPYLEPHHDVIAPTLAGHGGGPLLDPGVAPTLGALIDVIEDDLDQQGLQRVHIAGNSLGGAIAIELARRGRARSLVLFSPAGAWRSQRSIELRAAGIGLSVGMLSHLASHADSVAARPLLRRSLLAAQVTHPDRFSPAVFAASIRAMEHATVVPPLLREFPRNQVQPLPAAHDYPVRLVWGDRDRVLPFAGFGAPMLDRLPDAELVRLPDAGHVPMSDDPATVAKLILDVTRAVDEAEISSELDN